MASAAINQEKLPAILVSPKKTNTAVEVLCDGIKGFLKQTGPAQQGLRAFLKETKADEKAGLPEGELYYFLTTEEGVEACASYFLSLADLAEKVTGFEGLFAIVKKEIEEEDGALLDLLIKAGHSSVTGEETGQSAEDRIVQLVGLASEAAQAKTAQWLSKIDARVIEKKKQKQKEKREKDKGQAAASPLSSISALPTPTALSALPIVVPGATEERVKRVRRRSKADFLSLPSPAPLAQQQQPFQSETTTLPGYLQTLALDIWIDFVELAADTSAALARSASPAAKHCQPFEAHEPLPPLLVSPSASQAPAMSPPLPSPDPPSAAAPPRIVAALVPYSAESTSTASFGVPLESPSAAAILLQAPSAAAPGGSAGLLQTAASGIDGGAKKAKEVGGAKSRSRFSSSKLQQPAPAVDLSDLRDILSSTLKSLILARLSVFNASVPSSSSSSSSTARAFPAETADLALAFLLNEEHDQRTALMKLTRLMTVEPFKRIDLLSTALFCLPGADEEFPSSCRSQVPYLAASVHRPVQIGELQYVAASPSSSTSSSPSSPPTVLLESDALAERRVALLRILCHPAESKHASSGLRDDFHLPRALVELSAQEEKQAEAEEGERVRVDSSICLRGGPLLHPPSGQSVDQAT